MEAACKWCHKAIRRRGTRRPVFCCLDCKGEWQKTLKPLSLEQLYDLYVDRGLSTYQIAKRVRRDPKRVYEWLISYGIQPRPRQWSNIPGAHPFHRKAWLVREYCQRCRSAKDIASAYGVNENNIYFFLHKFGIRPRTTAETRKIKHWGVRGHRNPMFGKHGSANPAWRGGITPERQGFYLSAEWKLVSQKVWRRDKATCQRCGVMTAPGVQMHVHHKVSFAYTPLRAALSNLVLLCVPCHQWVHSKSNECGEWIERIPPCVS
jgi:hypothetical protein